MNTLLLVEDHHALAVAMSAAAERSGLEVLQAPSLASAREHLTERRVDGILLDLGLPDGNGLDLIRDRAWIQPPEIAVITAHGGIENAIAARQLGVGRFLDKPVDFDELREFFELVGTVNRATTTPEDSKVQISPFIGASASMRPVFRQIAHTCASEHPVVIHGATGTGKSQVAHLIHKSGSSDRPAIILHASSLTEEEELTATFRKSDGGSLIIESVEGLPPRMQAHLTRLIDQPGSEGPRIIATTDEEGLHPRVHEGSFQSDLYYRLKILELHLPTLSERSDDIPALCDCFLGELDASATTGFDDDVLAIFSNYDWPGNLRELRNVVNFALVTSAGARKITPRHIPEHLSERPRPSRESDTMTLALEAWVDQQLEDNTDYKELIGNLEGRLLGILLDRFDGKPSRLASALAMNRTTLRNKLKRVGD